jgi:hypothetical protein
VVPDAGWNVVSRNLPELLGDLAMFDRETGQTLAGGCGRRIPPRVMSSLEPGSAARILDLAVHRGSRKRAHGFLLLFLAVALHGGRDGGFPRPTQKAEAFRADAETPDKEAIEMKRALAIGAGMFFAAASYGADDNLVLNGDFEQVSPPSHFGCHFSFPDTPLVGWQLGGWHDVDGDRNTAECANQNLTVYHPEGGLIIVSLQGSICCECDNNGAIFQTVAHDAGEAHRLSVDVLLDPWDELTISVGGQSWRVLPAADIAWRTVQFDFTPESPSSVLRIASVGTATAPGCLEAEFAAIDNVRLVKYRCVGDTNLDSAIDGIDLATVLTRWGQSAAKFPEADCNRDGVIDGSDLAIVLGSWGACP